MPALALATPFNETQLRVLSAFANACFRAHEGAELEALIAAIPKDVTPDVRKHAIKLASTGFRDTPGALEQLASCYATVLPPAGLAELATTFSILATKAGTFLTTGYVNKHIYDLTDVELETVLRSWLASPVFLLRKAARGFTSIPLYSHYTYSESVALGTGYPASGHAEGKVHDDAQPSYPFVFETISTPFQVIETEILVLGSGSGGGVVASELAKGRKLLVVEKGVFVPTEKLSGKPADGLEQLYENNGLFATNSGAMNILAGSTFGGGSTVNWLASLAPQHYVRKDWAAAGLPHFLSDAFEDSIKAVQKTMGVSTAYTKHNKANQLLIDGCTRLGFHVEDVPQNTSGFVHSCGSCGFGCPSGVKAGGTATWLRQAAANNAKFLVSTSCQRLLFAASASSPPPTEATLANFSPSSSRRHCVGALVFQNGVPAIIRASTVVVSSGTINSPALLLRSGLRNPAIGKNLYLHPSSFVTGYFASRVDPWEGSILTTLSNAAENVDGENYGVKLEVSFAFPGSFAAGYQPWTSSLEHKKSMINFAHAFTVLCITRDRDTGRVVIDKDGKPRVDYSLSTHDGKSLVGGLVKAAEILLAAGATRIVSTQSQVEDYCRLENDSGAGIGAPAFKAWCEKVKQAGAADFTVGLGSAHQMGSCRMGTDGSGKSVVDPRGRVWGTQGLYVADASVLPSCSAVNPMLSTMSVSHSIAQFIKEDLHIAEEKLSRASL